jgi:hypothetical protein
MRKTSSAEAAAAEGLAIAREIAAGIRGWVQGVQIAASAANAEAALSLIEMYR